jgi:hypothetical protein
MRKTRGAGAAIVVDEEVVRIAEARETVGVQRPSAGGQLVGSEDILMGVGVIEGFEREWCAFWC